MNLATKKTPSDDIAKKHVKKNIYLVGLFIIYDK